MSFYKPAKLPKLMVAPNGARKVKKDHPAVPLTISETVATAKSCYEAGAGAIHLHVRDKEGQHVLDAGLYKEALNELEYQVPNMHIQVTTEAIGKYSPADMRKLAYDVTPPGASIGTSELIPSRKPEDIDLLVELLNKAEIQINDAWCLFVIGHYSGRISYPENISLFIKKMEEHKINLDWAICAFGKEEMSCLEKAVSLGGKLRVGFENSLFMPNGEIAPDNHIKVDAVNKLFQLN